MAQDVGDKKARELYQAFIKDFFERLSKIKWDYSFYFFGTPHEEETLEYFYHLSAKYQLKMHFNYQPELKFFDRLAWIFQKIHEDLGDAFIHLTGTDIPDFPFSLIKNCDDPNNVILGPDLDGGYYYLGAHAFHHQIFDIEYFLKLGHSVFAATKNQIEKLNLKTSIIDEWSDIDNLQDLKNTLKRSRNLVHTGKVTLDF